jgi:hypothetical protein
MSRALFLGWICVLWVLSLHGDRIAPTQYKNPYFLSNEEGSPILSCRLIGGLGNQLFQIASTFAIGWDAGYEVFFPRQDSTPSRQGVRPVYWESVFWQVPTQPVDFFTCFAWFEEPHIPLGPSFIENAILSGYWQDHHCFVKYREQILDLFSLPPLLTEKVERIFKEVTDHQSGPFVSVHIRLDDWMDGDFCLWKDEYKHYYTKALALFPSDAVYLVFSGNPLFSASFFQKNFPDKAAIFMNESDVIELFMMAKCDHNIIVNSTFSWWGAFLNRNPFKIVVSPLEWHFQEPRYREGYLPDEWIKIQVLD